MRKLFGFTMTRGIPADVSGAYRPNPQANNRTFPRESSSYSQTSLNGYESIGLKMAAKEQSANSFSYIASNLNPLPFPSPP